MLGISKHQMSITNLMCFLLSWGYLHGMKDRSSNYRSAIPWLQQPVVPKEVGYIDINTHTFFIKKFAFRDRPYDISEKPSRVYPHGLTNQSGLINVTAKLSSLCSAVHCYTPGLER